MSIFPQLPLGLPRSRAELEQLQRERKIVAVERARRSPWWKDKLTDINISKLDDPAEWRKIPILNKDDLRGIGTDSFYSDFCAVKPENISEYWRSGGSTGRPLFYPKTAEDLAYNMVGFTRTFECAGVAAGERVHVSFPLGIHPAGHMWARAAEIKNMGAIWAGAGTSLPSNVQLDLIQTLKPTVWMGMPSFGLHLANLAQAEGIDLPSQSIHTIMCTAEAVSKAKRDKLERDWGATVYDCFGMTEISMMGAEGPARDGFHIWTDLAFIEVLDPETWEPVAEGEPGRLIATSLFSNNAAPFLRWDSGDIVIYKSEGASDTPFSVFPVIQHAHRTAGFFKVRGVNINHAEFEDFMFADPQVNDFRVVVSSNDSGLDAFALIVELRRDSSATAAQDIAAKTKRIFEIGVDVQVLETGAIAREFASSVKALRFVDERM
ncbi:MAG: AMP-binding protein [Beijerinckiaceae bacterium]|nr:AMP-binding protein [Beijerinckiaceae bacterium]